MPQTDHETHHELHVIQAKLRALYREQGYLAPESAGADGKIIVANKKCRVVKLDLADLF